MNRILRWLVMTLVAALVVVDAAPAMAGKIECLRTAFEQTLGRPNACPYSDECPQGCPSCWLELRIGFLDRARACGYSPVGTLTTSLSASTLSFNVPAGTYVLTTHAPFGLNVNVTYNGQTVVNGTGAVQRVLVLPAGAGSLGVQILGGSVGPDPFPNVEIQIH